VRPARLAIGEDALIKFGYSLENRRNVVVSRGSWSKNLE
jgi:hypothetical protein